MDFKTFERRARRVWEEIPTRYREGVDGLVVERTARPHPTLADTYTLGECITETYPSEFGGPDTIRSIVVLYFDSFRHLAEDDPDFDWRYEIWETLTHEVRHHLESLADEDALEDVDYAADENFKRMVGEPFDPEFYQSGEALSDGVWEIERDIFVEVTYPAETEPRPWIPFRWHGLPHRVRCPASLGDICFVQIVGGVETGPVELCVVVVRQRSTWRMIQDWWHKRPLEIVEVKATAQQVEA
jgi:hypothetical protein